jgi:hypothetical protein
MGGPSRNGAATGNQETKNHFAKTTWALTTLGTLRAGTHVAPFVRVRNSKTAASFSYVLRLFSGFLAQPIESNDHPVCAIYQARLAV